MRTLVFSLLLIFAALQIAAKDLDSFVVIGDETFYCDKVCIGKSSTRIVSNGKTLLKVPTSMVSAYSQGGKLFERLPVINKKQDTAGWAFMQYITSKSGYRLYRYCSNCTNYDPETGTVAPAVPVYRYYIYKGHRYISMIDNNQVKTKLEQFGVKQLI